ncbi:unnamed protein product [Mucor hiemalis]
MSMYMLGQKSIFCVVLQKSIFLFPQKKIMVQLSLWPLLDSYKSTEGYLLIQKNKATQAYNLFKQGYSSQVYLLHKQGHSSLILQRPLRSTCYANKVTQASSYKQDKSSLSALQTRLLNPIFYTNKDIY